MDYTLTECPVCKKTFSEDDDIVVCPECGTPHHRECYKSLGRCANESRHAEGYDFRVLEKEKPEEIPIIKTVPYGAEQPTDEKPGDENGSGPSPFGFSFGFDLGKDVQIDGIPLEEVQQFVGRDSFSSRLVLNLAFTDKLKRLRPNFAAFFLPYIWLFYRKMYKLGVIFIVLTVLSSVAFTNRNTIDYTKKLFNVYMSAFSSEVPIDQLNAQLEEIQQKGTGNSYYYDAAPQIISLVLRLVVALFANKWYMQHMKKQIMKTREECSSMDEYMAALTVKGGKSLPAAIVSVLMFGALSIGYQLILIKLF